MSTGTQRTDDDEPDLEGEYDPAEVEPKWQDRWVENGTYAYRGATDPDTLFTIDTPPPTVSGNLHMGHLYQFTLQDFVARFHRMRDGDVFLPFGYDDNGIASERLTERELGVNHGDYERHEFQDLTREVTEEYEAEFTDDVQSLSVSVDWYNTYKTIEPAVQRVSQLSFVDLYEQGREYRDTAPTIWCPDCETAISQVETEDADRDAHYNDITFPLVDSEARSASDSSSSAERSQRKSETSASPETRSVSEDSADHSSGRSPREDGEGERDATDGSVSDGRAGGAREQSEPRDHPDRHGVTISTTRPELLPACVAMFVHPDDERTDDLVGHTARVPLFDHEVPIIEDERVDMEKGTGVVMSCTFGDQTDIEWYQAYDLPTRVAIDESGTMTDQAGDYAGMSTHEAREAIVEDLEAEGYLESREAISHTVQVHERCETDIEFLVTDQWYVRVLDKTDEYLAAGREMDWYPEKMFTRYEHWVEGLEWDWCISRQRDSGIPFPVWYCEDCGEPILAEKADLPVDPLSDDPPVDACPECGHDEFEPEGDVFDTWATSSLTPLINAGWDWRRAEAASDAAEGDPEAASDAAEGDPEAASDAAEGDDRAGEFTMDRPQLYPFDLRPQGHDIISFWLFHTVVKCYEHTGEVPFDAVMINGMVLDENREAMSKSKGNVVHPGEVLERFPVDAARYWAAGTSIGDDFPFKENDLVTGEKLLQKLWNASKLVSALAPADPEKPGDLDDIDEWLLASLDDVTREVTDHFAAYEFSKARDRLRSFFWNTFCDDYLEIAKQRDSASTEYALRTAHRRFLELFAPFLPHVTEELWHRLYADDAGTADHAASAADTDTGPSIHTADWPEPAGYEADREAGETAMEVISALRGYKTDRGLALNADLDRVAVYGDVDGFEDAIASAMHVRAFERLDEEPETETRIVDVDLDYATVGPEYGETVGEIDAAIESGEFEIEDGELHVACETLGSELFEVERERTYRGDGELLQTEHAVVIVG
jgi:valyl-tRNA synthetase